MDDLRERVEAVERAVTDGDGDLSALADGAARAERVTELEATVEDLRRDVAELEAATQALRGYVGNVRSVNEDVERRADAAVAAVESLEERVDGLAGGRSAAGSGSTVHAAEAEPERTDRPGEPTVHTGRERSGPTAHSREDCPTCGRGQASAAADGGSPSAGEGSGTGPSGPVGENVTDETAGSSTRSRAGSVARPALGEFDPNGRSDRVTVSRPDAGTAAQSTQPAPEGGQSHARDTESTDGGLLARARELL